ncbi:hypothetical protein Poly59_45970 [Rubripirellula reticaptiva]|uniref:Uncharacterized protein n=1 Tax=Rubripirellula reticaptiva TaxID=2528013 RepID=A0A5C6EJC5_9BACT|nr:hypothetical protein Poly59_45970 [Rubripirellula reticaptiva]
MCGACFRTISKTWKSRQRVGIKKVQNFLNRTSSDAKVLSMPLLTAYVSLK